MFKITKAAFAGCVSVVLLATGGFAVADPMEAVFSIDVSNPAAFVAAMDTVLSSEDLRDEKVTLWATQFGGSNPASHIVVAEYDSYEDFQTLTRRRIGSPDWARFALGVQGVSETTASLMAIQRIREGSGWRGHGAMAAFIMTIKDPTTYMAAFRDLIGSMDNPGSVRLMEVRAGGDGVTHVALISAPDFADLNNYLDKLLSNKAYKTFTGKVGNIRTIQTVEMLRRVKSWET